MKDGGSREYALLLTSHALSVKGKSLPQCVLTSVRSSYIVPGDQLLVYRVIY